MALDWTPPAEVPDADYPFTLSTGRRLYHYHTRTQTGRCEGLNEVVTGRILTFPKWMPNDWELSMAK